ncbi:DUF885 domain-containing protein [Tahibacter amnicola]|uniref:DUF885 domain-containing protein n=1 Tax=Tahibacter amnicola TaxID=2976241 RepID=A0ABY6BF62_9GAMM|nr:DUF885 domain-containing protein [Tahibacter amnicola]UXI68394.1 DUF885 domain-containing protein [Tahibacter amnicola]
MRLRPLRSLCLVLAFTLGAPALADEATDRAFKDLYQREWTWRLKQYPTMATAVGVHDYDDQLGHVSAKHQAERLRDVEAFRKELAAIDPARLSEAEQTNYAIFRTQLDNFIESVQVKAYLMPINSDSSFYADLPMMAESHPFASVADYEHYIKRLYAVAPLFDEYIGLLREGVKSGMTVPRVVLEGRDGPIRTIAEQKSPAEGPFYAPFNKIPASISKADAERLRREGEKAIATAVRPAFAKLLKYFTAEYLPKARKTLGAYDLPNGKAYYQLMIRDFTTLDMSPEQIHQIGLAEVARIRSEMEKVMREAKFEGDFAAFLHFLRTDPQFYAKTPRELLMHASYYAKRIDGELPKYFSVLPRLPYGIAPVPETIAPYYTGGRYSPAPEGGRGAGFYWVNTYKLDSRPLYILPALTLHESVPGHHLQGALAMEQGEQPPFRRYNYISAYGEGWALYAEHLGVEMGIYETPYEHFGRLTYEMWRACRLVIDTGIHAKGWTREQAQALLRDNTALSEHELTTEVDRYISWPGQALSYKLGEIKIRELRAKAEKALGAAFDLRTFHDTLLALGSVPLPVLEKRIDQYIAQNQARR